MVSFYTRTAEEREQAIRELEQALSIAALRNVIEHREKQHKTVKPYRQMVGLLVARKIVAELQRA